MFIPKTAPNNFKHQDKKLSNTFSILVWNIHKENQSDIFAKSFYHLIKRYPSDILLLQEVKYPKKEKFFFHHYSYAFAGNIETKRTLFGVLTASKCSFFNNKTILSEQKELGFSSHKSYLLTQHKLNDDTTLTILNLHAINFVKSKTFASELHKLKQILKQLKGPLIVAGDFNSWSKKRHKILSSFQRELALEKLTLTQEKNIKRFFWHTLDHIYYRGIYPKQALAIDTKDISDHNPLYASFELIP